MCSLCQDWEFIKDAKNRAGVRTGRQRATRSKHLSIAASEEPTLELVSPQVTHARRSQAEWSHACRTAWVGGWKHQASQCPSGLQAHM